MKIILIILNILCFCNSSFAQNTIRGTVLEASSNDPAAFAIVHLYKNEVHLLETKTDKNGAYAFTNIDAGTYNVEVAYIGFGNHLVTNIYVKNDVVSIVNFEMNSWNDCSGWIVKSYRIPLIELDNLTSGQTLNNHQIRRRRSSF